MKQRWWIIITAVTGLVLCSLFNTLMGAQSINVKKYPPKLQQSYQLFVTKCSACHDLASTIRSDYVLPSYFKEMVHEMQQMEDSNISTAEADEIYEFLVYDAFKRRKRELKRELKPLNEENKEKEKEMIRAVVNKYKDDD